MNGELSVTVKALQNCSIFDIAGTAVCNKWKVLKLKKGCLMLTLLGG
jgi:hypothetical protein